MRGRKRDRTATRPDETEGDGSMNKSMLRIFQVAVALLIFTVVTIAILVVVGMLGQEQAIRIGLNVSSIIGICLVASLVLMGALGIGSGSAESDGELKK